MTSKTPTALGFLLVSHTQQILNLKYLKQNIKNSNKQYRAKPVYLSFEFWTNCLNLYFYINLTELAQVAPKKGRRKAKEAK